MQRRAAGIRDRSRVARAAAGAGPLAAALLLQACCAAKQPIPLDCVPRTVTVFVDGERLEEAPRELELRSDEPHTLFFSGGGYEKRSLILDSRETEDGHRLDPSEPCRELRFEPVEKSVEFEVDEEAGPPR